MNINVNLEAYLKASNTGNADFFGGNVAISGNTIAVAANGEDSIATGINSDQSNNTLGTIFSNGAVYIFIKNGLNWSQQAYIKASNTQIVNMFGLNGDDFGNRIALDGNILVVNANTEDSNVTGINGNQSNNSD